ncbi:helix-turn-helix transcriptional regulator [Sanguibacter hominis ATCC BAA-789]|uniref:Helix-turn-helix transcriptional regulator n=1 Tax=Sanguibacter hominis ATCC BAA-789 TaxID=1312740 RepID=A0A9X5FF89_9MICO|nr:helix-turn-helix transcriptional regulator [Sanguibacter hominis ATCC BAA-789]
MSNRDFGRDLPAGGRRKTVMQECSWSDVARAIRLRPYRGAVVRAARVPDVLAAFDACPHPRLMRMREDGRATLRHLLTVLAWSSDWEVQRRRREMLVSVPQRELARRCGRTERTVRRHLRVLEEIGMLATVREGISAEARPFASGDEGNVVPVYVLLIPRSSLDGSDDAPDVDDGEPTIAEDAQGGRRHLSLVDIDVLPSGSPFRGTLVPTHTRARRALHEPLRGPDPSGGAPRRRLRSATRQPGLDEGHVTRSPEEKRRPNREIGAVSTLSWPAYEVTKSKRDRLAASDELRNRLPVLRHISAAHVRYVVREFFLAGWTVADVAYAVDHRLDGSPWPHSGADGVARPADWLAYRLSAWRDEAGTVRRSRGQRIEAERVSQRARQRVARDRAAAAEAKRAENLVSPRRAKIIESIHSNLPPRRRR